MRGKQNPDGKKKDKATLYSFLRLTLRDICNFSWKKKKLKEIYVYIWVYRNPEKPFRMEKFT